MSQVRLRLLARGMMCVLCRLRDECGLSLDAAAVALRLPLDALSGLAENGGIPEAARAPLRDYLSSLPSYGADRDRQSASAAKQHNVSAMGLNEMLSTMRDAYGHVFCAGGSDVDMRDVLENRRVLLVLLPARVWDNVSSPLGRLVVETLATALREAGRPSDAGNDRRAAAGMHAAKEVFLAALEARGAREAGEGLRRCAAACRAIPGASGPADLVDSWGAEMARGAAAGPLSGFSSAVDRTAALWSARKPHLPSELARGLVLLADGPRVLRGGPGGETLRLGVDFAEARRSLEDAPGR